jgi:hypothetical protein
MLLYFLLELLRQEGLGRLLGIMLLESLAHLLK